MPHALRAERFEGRREPRLVDIVRRIAGETDRDERYTEARGLERDEPLGHAVHHQRAVVLDERREQSAHVPALRAQALEREHAVLAAAEREDDRRSHEKLL